MPTNHYDAIISRGRMPPEPAPEETPPAAGYSYYWDRRAEGHSHRAAAVLAAHDMRNPADNVLHLLSTKGTRSN